ncbi:MAG: ABC transporter substrate-binding protein [Thermoleophilia bacterium]
MKRRDEDLFRSFLAKPFTRRDLLKGAAVLGAGAAMAPVISACGSGSSTTTSPSALASPTAGGHLRVGLIGGSVKETLDGQAFAGTEPMMVFIFNMYESLMEYSPTGELQMCLAESVDANEAATQFTAKLQSGLTFHNGKDVTADDVVYSFKRVLTDQLQGATQLIGLKASGVKKIDDLTVQFNLESPNAVFKEALAAYSNCIVPVDYNPKGANGAIGTGAFKIDSFKPGEQAVFSKYPNYWREVYLDQLTCIEFADPSARVNALQDGTVDYLNQIESANIPVLQSAGAFTFLKANTGMWQPFTMNLNTKPFDDVKVRQAMRLIVDRQQMIDQTYNGDGWVGNDMYSPFDPAYPKDFAQRAQDLEQAKALLKEAGYDNDLAVTLTTSDGITSTAVAQAQVFAEQAKGAGVTVKVNKVDSNTFWGDQYLKWPFAQDFWGTRNYLVQAAIGTMPDAVYNETHFSSHYPEWLDIVTEAFQTVDDTKRNELIRAAYEMEYNEGGYIIWGFQDIQDAMNEKVRGVVADYSGLSGSAARSRYRLAYMA